jgi:DNA-binding MarR family transcriptional regulator
MSAMDDTHRQLVEAVTSEFGELRQAADRLDEAVAMLYALNRTDLRCLGIIYERGRVTPGELAEETGLTPGAITTALDRLEKSGFANRVADPEDRRRVLVLSTMAAREVGARLYGEVQVASERLLEPRTTEELTAIRDYLQGTRRVYEGQVDEIAAALGGQGAVSAAGAIAGVVGGAGAAGAPSLAAAAAAGRISTAPIAGAGSGRLTFSRGAAGVVLRGDAALAELYRARFEGTPPDVLVDGNSVTIQVKRRFRPFDWRTQSTEVALNTGLPWAVVLRGGMWKLEADLRLLQLESFELTGGASEMEIWLPAPQGRTVPIRLTGGASNVQLHRPVGVAMRAELTGGASHLVFDEQRLGSIGGRNHFSTPGFADAVGRYEVRFSGGASQITIDTV